jgi:hypothetical protein
MVSAGKSGSGSGSAAGLRAGGGYRWYGMDGLTTLASHQSQGRPGCLAQSPEHVGVRI